MLQLFRLVFMLIDDTCETSSKNGMQIIFVYNTLDIESNSIILITGGLPVSGLQGLKA